MHYFNISGSRNRKLYYSMISATIIILQFLITAIFVCGFYYASLEGEILYPFRVFMSKLFGKKDDIFPNKFAEYLWKPVLGCPMCMVSIYGIPLYLFITYSHAEFWVEFVTYTIITICAAGINGLLVNLNLFE